MNQSNRPSGCFKKILQAAVIIILSLIGLLAVLGIYQATALSTIREQFPAPGQLINVQGHLMHLNCTGSGSPTVVIDAGNGSFSVEWFPIQAALSQVTRVCTYDRAGYGWSNPASISREGLNVVSELHDLLEAGEEQAPYLLIGHSLGGVHVRLFALQYPAEVSGLVLVDTAYPLNISPEFERQIHSSIGFYQVMDLMTTSGILRILGPLSGENCLPATARKLPAEFQQVYLNLLLDPNQYKTASAEMKVLPQTFEQTSTLLVGPKPFGNLPILVLTAGQTLAPGSTPFAETYVPVSKDQIQLQAELAGQSTMGDQRIIHSSGHSMHLDSPKEVVQAVFDLIQIIKNK